MGRKFKKKQILLILVISFLFSSSLFNLGSPKVHAASGIVINEIMYNPLSDNGDDEFLELHNPTDSSVDISGWCFTEGITVCFDDNTSIEANGYLVISPNADQTQISYGVTPSAIYTGSLSNGGETLTLRNTANEIEDSVTYDDASPWPLSPDGSGPSLELKEAALDNSQAASWGASLSNGGTPGEINSLTGTELPTISTMSKPSNVQASDSPTITVMVDNATSVSLVYRVGFEAETTLDMYDDGLHGDGISGDGIYGAEIPAQTARSLVRYKVTATNDDGVVSKPSADESINYEGYIIKDPSLTSSAPILEWFITDDDYDDLIATPDDQKIYFPAVVAYGDQVFDNSEIRLKGEYSRTFPKKPFKVKLPSGHKVEIPGSFDVPVSEFHLNSELASNEYILSLISWRAFEYAGFPVPQRTKIQLQRNGQFEGAYTMTEKYDTEWFARHEDYQNDEVYEDWGEKVQPEDGNTANRDDWKTNLTTLTGDAKRNYLLDNQDIANTINYMAVSAAIRSHDWSAESNHFSFKDVDGTGRWRFLPWDLDLTFTNIGMTLDPPVQGYGYMIDPYDTVSYITPESRFHVTAIWDDPILKQMYLRRVRTLIDAFYTQGRLEQWIDEEFAIAEDPANLDYELWFDYENGPGSVYDQVRSFMPGLGLDPDNPADCVTVFQSFLPFIDFSELPDPITAIEPLTPANRAYILKQKLLIQLEKYNTIYLQNNLLVPSATKNTVVINEIMYNPAGGSEHEFIELHNPHDEAIDMSGWKLNTGSDFIFPGGSVVPANGYALVVKNDPAFRSHYGGGKLIFGQFNDTLSNTGETITLKRADNSTVSNVSYGISGSWPASAANQGRSLNLRNSDKNQSEACSWAPSSSNDGSPGATNSIDDTWSPVACNPATETITNPVGTVISTLKRTSLAFAHIVTSAGMSEETPTTEETISFDKRTGNTIPKPHEDTTHAIDQKKKNSILKPIVIICGSIGGIGLLLFISSKAAMFRKPG